MAAKVYVTGVGAITSAGMSAQATWENVLAGKVCLSEIQNYDLTTWTHKIGGEIHAPQLSQLLPDRKLLKLISRQDVFGINAATQAIEDSGMLAYREALSDRTHYNETTGIYVGSPGNKFYQQYDFLPLMAKTNDMQQFASHLFETVHPMWLLKILPNNVLAYVGIHYGFKGANQNITNHAVGGAQAILEAYHAIQTGQIDRAIVVAYDVGPEPQALFYYQRLSVLSHNHLKPFDINHNGTILSEGAAAIILESEQSVKSRNATPYLELVGGKTATEATGLFSIEEDGEALTLLLDDTLSAYGLSHEDLSCVVAHGNGNPKSDITEALALKRILKNKETPITAYKWSMGHTLCASGILDVIMTAYAHKNSLVPGIPVLDKPAELCSGLNLVKDTHNANSNHTLLINRGFGSMNVCLVVK